MANFLQYYNARLLPFEGGYNLIKQDRGGETYKGVARNANPSWPGWKIVDEWKAKKGGKLPYNYIIPDKTLDNLVHGLYKQKYWDALQADFIKNQVLAEILVDFYVNGGYSTSKLQKYLKIPADGQFGPKTLDAINKANQKNLFEWVWNWRKSHYDQIVKNNPDQKIFSAGWNNRLKSFFFSE